MVQNESIHNVYDGAKQLRYLLVDVRWSSGEDDAAHNSSKPSNQAISIAKLSGLKESRLMDPIIAESDDEHFDSIEKFLYEKEIQFFDLQCQAKIALDGILAGSSGLDLSAAQNMVFLELSEKISDFEQVRSSHTSCYSHIIKDAFNQKKEYVGADTLVLEKLRAILLIKLVDRVAGLESEMRLYLETSCAEQLRYLLVDVRWSSGEVDAAHNSSKPSNQAISIAKLSGLKESRLMHPIIAESDDEHFNSSESSIK
ncbi:hypothetical protein Tco_0477588 [Tanacetum coccineum]